MSSPDNNSTTQRDEKQERSQEGRAGWRGLRRVTPKGAHPPLPHRRDGCGGHTRPRSGKPEGGRARPRRHRGGEAGRRRVRGWAAPTSRHSGTACNPAQAGARRPRRGRWRRSYPGRRRRRSWWRWPPRSTGASTTTATADLRFRRGTTRRREQAPSAADSYADKAETERLSGYL